MADYITKNGETLDDIVFEKYGLNPHMIEALTKANPHTLELGVHLPAGIEINLPPVTAVTTEQTAINLWD